MRDRARHLEPDDGPEPALAQLRFHGLEQIVCVVGDLGVAVAGQPECRPLDELHLGEEPGQEVLDHRLQRDREPAVTDRDPARQTLGDLHAREPFLARLRIPDDDPEVQREPGDVRERLTRPDGERGQHREDLAGKVVLELRQLVGGRVVDRTDDDALGRESGAELVAPQKRLGGDQIERARTGLVERLLWAAAIRGTHRKPRRNLVVQSGDTHHEELVEHRREDRTELHALEQRLVRVGCEVEDARVHVEPRQLAIQLRCCGWVGL